MIYKLLFAGRPVPQKGLSDLLSALCLLEEFNWCLTIVGELPKDISISDFTFYDRVHLLGAIPNSEMPLILNTNDILVVPSHYENFGNIIIEGLACGVLIIASRIGGMKNLIENGYNGLLFEPKDHIQLSEKLKFVFEHPDITQQIRTNALLSSTQYDWKNIITKTLELFEKFIH